MGETLTSDKNGSKTKDVCRLMDLCRGSKRSWNLFFFLSSLFADEKGNLLLLLPAGVIDGWWEKKKGEMISVDDPCRPSDNAYTGRTHSHSFSSLIHRTFISARTYTRIPDTTSRREVNRLDILCSEGCIIIMCVGWKRERVGRPGPDGPFASPFQAF